MNTFSRWIVGAASSFACAGSALAFPDFCENVYGDARDDPAYALPTVGDPVMLDRVNGVAMLGPGAADLRDMYLVRIFDPANFHAEVVTSDFRPQLWLFQAGTVTPDADVDGNGMINFDDLLAMLLCVGDPPGDCPDLFCDGVIDIKDVAVHACIWAGGSPEDYSALLCREGIGLLGNNGFIDPTAAIGNISDDGLTMVTDPGLYFLAVTSRGPAPCNVSCDVDGDGDCDFDDLLQLTGCVGNPPGPGCPDLNCDGVVDVADVEEWVCITGGGPCAPYPLNDSEVLQQEIFTFDVGEVVSGPDALFGAVFGAWVGTTSLEGTYSIELTGVEFVQPGACCIPNLTCQDLLFESQCTAAGGTFLGEQSDCDDADTGACCIGLDCTLERRAVCCALGGVWTDDVCAAVTCDSTGACCLPDDSCLEILRSACEAMGGRFLGTDTICAQFQTGCEGACCLPDDMCLPSVTEDLCTLVGGVFAGVGTLVSNCEIGGECEGACCLPDGTCVTEDLTGCETLGGTWRGPGIGCGSLSCAGACCMPDGSCVFETADVCATTGGSFQGIGSTCAAIDCCAILCGACCLPGPACVEGMFETDCTNAGGSFLGAGASCAGGFFAGCMGCCAPAGCIYVTDTFQGITECLGLGGVPGADGELCPADTPCHACGDTNSDGEVNFDDTLNVLSWYGFEPVNCFVDVNDDGQVGFADLLIVLSFSATGPPCPAQCPPP